MSGPIPVVAHDQDGRPIVAEIMTAEDLAARPAWVGGGARQSTMDRYTTLREAVERGITLPDTLDLLRELHGYRRR